MKKYLPFLIAFLLPVLALAQTVPLATSHWGGTITTTNTWQVIQGKNNGRNGCTVQNNGSHTMYVYFDSAGTAACSAGSVGNSFALAPNSNGVAGQALNCAIASNLILSSQVCIYGTS